MRSAKKFITLIFCFFLILGAAGRNLHAEEAIILIDAEFSHKTSTSAQAIELGARIAADEINQSGLLGNLKLVIRTSDNRAASAIAVDHFLEAVRNPSIIAVMGGKFSPVQMEVVPHTARNRLMLLNPWGSADGIVDNGFQPNWVFRLSLKDEFASAAFLREAKARGASRIGLILPNTAWGRSNLAALQKRADAHGVTIAASRSYNSGERSMIGHYHALIEAGADLIILVANEMEGAIFAKELSALDDNLKRPVLSHWGITGGDFDQLAQGAFERIDLRVIQTFSFYTPRTRKAEVLLERVIERTGARRISDIESPVGIAHAYDLTWLVALALRQAGSLDRGRLRDAMEHLPAFEGAVRHYAQPFSGERHEALSSDEVFFARYDGEGGLTPITP